MKIILSPTKKMCFDPDEPGYTALPTFLPQTERLLAWLRTCSREQLKSVWSCSDKLIEQNVERLHAMDLYRNLSPAIFSYQGLAFQHMLPTAFDAGQLTYIRDHLRILSAFYGVLKPMDGITPYRLEMQAKASVDGHPDLYHFWGDRLYHAVRDESGIIIDLASAEYARCIRRHLAPNDRYIRVIFREGNAEKPVTRATYAKMARGEMVRFMAENRIEDPAHLADFDRLNYVYRPEHSTPTEFVFERR